MNREYIWETFDSLFMTIHRQGRRLEEQEARIEDLERRLNEHAAAERTTPHLYSVNDVPAERAA